MQQSPVVLVLAELRPRHSVEAFQEVPSYGNAVNLTHALELRTLTQINLPSLAICGLFGFYAAQREATIVAKYAAVSPVLDERSRRRWAAAESVAIGYGGDALVSSATGLARETLRKGRREITQGGTPSGRIRRPGAGRPRLEQRQPGLLAALEGLVDPLTRGDPTSPLRWTCKSRAKLASGLAQQGWRVSSTTVGRLLHQLGYRLQSARKRQEGASHPDRNAQFEHINATRTRFWPRGSR